MRADSKLRLGSYGLSIYTLIAIGLMLCVNFLDFFLFSDDTNVFLNDTKFQKLESNLNIELEKSKPIVKCKQIISGYWKNEF